MQKPFQYARFADVLQNDTGRIQFNIFSDNVAMPLPNARITIKDATTDETVQELFSNESGQTAEIDLSAPPVEISLNEDSDQMPYATYNADIIAEGYMPLKIEGIQILPKSTALQSAYLNPTETNVTKMRQDNIEVIDIGEHTLYGDYPPKTPEPDVKPLPEESGFVVLDNPVIPEYVVVHDGSPKNNSAQDYWVKYSDYIKNVASSEIYSTWPTETIKANVLAIQSFTLNRVFTEWYRNQGYNFTITSSTGNDKKR